MTRFGETREDGGDSPVPRVQRPEQQKQEAVLKATAVRSPLPAGNVVDSSLSSLSSLGGGGVRQGEGGWGGGGGHFIHPAIYCTITWCFALKGLRTITIHSARKRAESSCVHCPLHWGGVARFSMR